MNISKIITEEIENFLFNDGIISAGSYIFCHDENGEYCILAGKRGSTAPSCPNMYNVPVGMREEGETAQECAKRECMEETDLDLPLNKFKFVEKEEWAKGKIGSNFIVVLDGMTTDYHIGMGDGENDRFQWIPLSQLNRFPWAYGMGNTVLKMSKYI